MKPKCNIHIRDKRLFTSFNTKTKCSRNTYLKENVLTAPCCILIYILRALLLARLASKYAHLPDFLFFALIVAHFGLLSRYVSAHLRTLILQMLRWFALSCMLIIIFVLLKTKLIGKNRLNLDSAIYINFYLTASSFFDLLCLKFWLN